MQRIILRHLKGSKANQTEEFPVGAQKELTFGRDQGANVQYDPDRDDLVSRVHARLAQDAADSNRYTIEDLDSRNGTFVNNKRVSGAHPLSPGDIVQFGPGGPEFQFDLDPRPEGAMRSTRMSDAAQASASPPTRTAPASGPPSTSDSQKYIGRQTLEREISRVRTETKRQSRGVLLGGAALGLILIGGVAGLAYRMSKQPPPKVIIEKPDSGEKKPDLDSTAIARDNRDSVVYIEVSWRLTDTLGGRQIYHVYHNGLPVYIRSVRRDSDNGGDYEPELEVPTAGNPPTGKPIGFSAGGSGFIVTSDGYILTNKHLAAAWEMPYPFDDGLLLENGEYKPISGSSIKWVPSQAFKERNSLSGQLLRGKNDSLKVTLADNKTGIPVSGDPRTSDESDVALIKVNLPTAFKAVKLPDGNQDLEQGARIAAMGYPLAKTLGPGVVVIRDKMGIFGLGSRLAFVPEPTITDGIVARIMKEGKNPQSYTSLLGDVYQITAAASPGNSGGPVFNAKGEVIGILTVQMTGVQGANFAVPIRYGQDLMGTQNVQR